METLQSILEKLKRTVIEPKPIVDEMEDETGLNLDEESVSNGGGFSAQLGEAPTNPLSNVTVNGKEYPAKKKKIKKRDIIEESNKYDYKVIRDELRKEFSYSGRGFKAYKQAHRYKIVVDFPDTGYSYDTPESYIESLTERADNFAKKYAINFEAEYHANYGYLQLKFFVPIMDNNKDEAFYNPETNELQDTIPEVNIDTDVLFENALSHLLADDFYAYGDYLFDIKEKGLLNKFINFAKETGWKEEDLQLGLLDMEESLKNNPICKNIRKLNEQLNKLLEEKQEFVIKTITPFGRAKICTWIADDSSTAIKEFIAKNPAYADNKKGTVIAELNV
jgi:hypothetical protein